MPSDFKFDKEFYKGKRVLVTGCTGFKGSWLCEMLLKLGADVYGFALNPNEISLFEMLELEKKVHYSEIDIRREPLVNSFVRKAKPEIVFHLAAQPLVSEGYNDPVKTYETNVMGTVYLLNAVRNFPTARCFVNVTTDKVYQNDELGVPFTETDRLNGHDPYSNSKSCSELATDSFYKSFLNEYPMSVITARAGNVIGGCDFAYNRIIPDCWRASNDGELYVRSPESIRPYQHVIDVLLAYLWLGQYGCEHRVFDSFNIGPDDESIITTKELVELYLKHTSDKFDVKYKDNPIKEQKVLKLNCAHIKDVLSWVPLIDIDEAVKLSAEVYDTVYESDDVFCEAASEVVDAQIDSFLK